MMTPKEKAEQFLTENSDWFDKSPGGEKLYFESEVIRMMNDFADKQLSEQQHTCNGKDWEFHLNIVDEIEQSEDYFCAKNKIGQRCKEQCLGCFQFEKKD